ncbi:MAG: ATP-binding protein [bacterium]|nr:ATP-binding protein [bacterium]
MELIESEILELKENWHDVYLKTICAFANTRGGKLIIGITDKKILF